MTLLSLLSHTTPHLWLKEEKNTLTLDFASSVTMCAYHLIDKNNSILRLRYPERTIMAVEFRCRWTSLWFDIWSELSSFLVPGWKSGGFARKMMIQSTEWKYLLVKDTHETNAAARIANLGKQNNLVVDSRTGATWCDWVLRSPHFSSCISSLAVPVRLKMPDGER